MSYIHGSFGGGGALRKAKNRERLLGSSTAVVLEAKLKDILQRRERRNKFFPDDLFFDPAWDILLNLALAELQQRRMSVSALCFSMGVPQTTALRWIKSMTDNGWVLRSDDPLDARRKFLELSEFASVKMLDYLAGIEIR